MMIYLIRHGQDDPNRLGGWSEYPLTDIGIAQVEAAADFLSTKGIQEIYSSDIIRAKQTAEIIAEKLNLQVEYTPEFRESNNGDMAGITHEEAEERFPGIWWSNLDWDQHWPNGESPHQFYERIIKAWLNLKVYTKGKTALLVTHGGVMNLIMCYENNIPYTNKKNEYQLEETEVVLYDEDNIRRMNNIKSTNC